MRLASSTLAGGALHVKRHQWLSGCHERRSGRRVQPRRAEVGAQLPCGQPLRQSSNASAAQLRARAPPRELAVQEDGHVELIAQLGGRHQRLRARGAPLGRVEIHHRHHVHRAHMGMLADVRLIAAVPHVDPPHRHPRAREQGGGQLALDAGEREHRAVVVRVGMDIQQARGTPGGERLCDRLDRPRFTTLGDVWDR
jgi:hypothetical protein